MITALIVLFVLSSGAVTAFVAGQRGRDILPWYLFGLLLGPLAWIAASLAPKRHTAA
ncbi:MAG: hypothetical protein H6595_03330 [Flavobacteriales bacterium]|nr:hypothetical protein [Flavobacteriales bacterium]MCB9166490.1 hypothetical protein [Flavobacteriales bacterium]